MIHVCTNFVFEGIQSDLEEIILLLPPNYPVTSSHSPGSEDYATISTSLTFSAEFSRSCVNVSIPDDSELELAETFGLSLTADEGVTLEPNRTTVTIIDQSCKSPKR